MELKKKLHFFMIGEGSILIECIESLLNRQHIVLGIISSDVDVIEWCSKKQIPCINQDSDIYRYLKSKNYDILLSINNKVILKENVLMLSKKYSINYHNSLLPKYAGINASSWALINNEEKHGITWHIMTTKIDEGYILKQCSFRIEKNDTSEKINIKCFEKAIESFSNLMDDLENEKEIPTKIEVDKKTYFDKFMVPENGCIISFNNLADNIIRFVNALNFGRFKNPLGAPKIYVDNKYFIITNIHITAQKSSMTPGSITNIKDNYIQISTNNYDIIVKNIYDIYGNSIKLKDFILNNNIELGCKLNKIPQFIIKRINDLYNNKYDDIWVDRLGKCNPISLPYKKDINTNYGNLNIEATSNLNKFTKVMSLSHSISNFVHKNFSENNSSLFLQTAFLIFLSRISMKNTIEIGFCNDDLKNQIKGLGNFFTKYFPLKVEIKKEHTFFDVCSSLKEEIKLMKKIETFSNDILFRYPKLNNIQELKCESFFPITIEITNNVESYTDLVPLGTELKLIINKNGLEYKFLYNTNMVNSDTINKIMNNFAVILNSIVSDSLCKTSYLPILTSREEDILLNQWNGEVSNYSHDVNVHQLFEKCVKKSPNATALVHENKKLTYKELNDLSNQLAHLLINLGVTSNTLVGIFMDRSLKMIISILGIMKAGGAYVPIDPDYSEERVSFIINDTGMKVCISLKKFSDEISKYQLNVIYLDRDVKKLSKQPSSNLSLNYDSQNLAYIIYTSGSTGKPKGVMIMHKSVVALLDGCEKLVPSKDKTIGTLVSTFSFDTSVWEMFTIICYGGELHIISQDCYTNSERFADYLIENKVTTVYMNPALIEDTIKYLANSSKPNFINYFKTGLEPKKQKILQFVRDKFPKTKIANIYGPTETTVCATFYDYTRTNNLEEYSPIGKAMPNYEVYIVDKDLKLLPIGVPGELLIGGVCTSKGYLNRPTLTNEKFITNPFNSSDKFMVYRTGDFVRFLDDGNIEFIGRKDNQVKIHGYRVELGEIENVLSQHYNVKKAVVSVMKYSNDLMQLVAYVILGREEKNMSRMLKSFLDDKLPSYMVPAHIIVMESLPVLLNGKLNKNALPMPNITENKNYKTRPTNDFQKKLIDIWEELFNLKNISINDNFFDLGGYSLLAARLFNEINKQLNINIPLSTIYRASTIEKLDKVINQNSNFKNWSSIIPMRKEGTKPPLFVLHGLGGDTFIYDKLVKCLGNDYPVYGIQLTEKISKFNIKELSNEYRKEIESIIPNGPYLLCGFSFGGLLAFEIASQLSKVGKQVDLLALLDSYSPMGNALTKKTILKIISQLVMRIYSDGPVSVINRIMSYLKSHKSQSISIEKYLPQKYNQVVTLFYAKRNDSIRYSLKEDLGWNDFTTKPLDRIELNCDHMEMMKMPNVEILSEELKVRINNLANKKLE